MWFLVVRLYVMEKFVPCYNCYNLVCIRQKLCLQLIPLVYLLVSLLDLFSCYIEKKKLFKSFGLLSCISSHIKIVSKDNFC